MTQNIGVDDRAEVVDGRAKYVRFRTAEELTDTLVDNVVYQDQINENGKVIQGTPQDLVRPKNLTKAPKTCTFSRLTGLMSAIRSLQRFLRKK